MAVFIIVVSVIWCMHYHHIAHASIWNALGTRLELGMRLTHTHKCMYLSLYSWCWLMDWMVSLLPVNKTTFKVPYYKYCWWQHFLPATFWFSSHPSSLSSYWYHCCFYSMLCHLLHSLLSFPLYSHLQGSVYHCWRTNTGQMYPLDYSYNIHYFYYSCKYGIKFIQILHLLGRFYVHEFYEHHCTAAVDSYNC